MQSVILSHWRERRIGVIWQDLGPLTTACTSEFWMCCRRVILPARQTCRSGYIFYLPQFLLFFNLRQIISGSTGPIFTIFSPNESYLREFSRSGPLFYSIRDVAKQLILGRICEMTFIQHAGISQRIQISQFSLKVIKGTIFATFCAILVKIGVVVENQPQLGCNLTIFIHLACWHYETD